MPKKVADCVNEFSPHRLTRPKSQKKRYECICEGSFHKKIKALESYIHRLKYENQELLRNRRQLQDRMREIKDDRAY